MGNDPGKRHWQYKQLVPVVDNVTEEILGKARPSKIVGAWTDDNNFWSYINFKGENVACSCDTSKQELKIIVHKNEKIWLE